MRDNTHLVLQAALVLLWLAACGLGLAACGGSDSGNTSDSTVNTGADASADTVASGTDMPTGPSDTTITNDASTPSDTTAPSDTSQSVGDADATTPKPDVVVIADIITDPDFFQQPPLVVCQSKTFSKWTSRVDFLAIDTSTDGVVTDSASGQTYYNILGTELAASVIPQANTALIQALDGYVAGKPSSLGPTSVLFELLTNVDTIDENTPEFSAAVYGAYVEGFGQSLTPCAYHLSNVGEDPICNYDVDIFSFDTSGNQCKARFNIAKTAALKNSDTQKLYIRGTQPVVDLVLPIIGGPPVSLDIHDVVVDATLELSHTANQQAVPGAYLGKTAPTGIMAGIACADKLGELVNRFIPGGTNYAALLTLLAASAKDNFKVENDPCAKDGRNSQGLRVVLRFRTIPGNATKVIESPTQTNP